MLCFSIVENMPRSDQEAPIADLEKRAGASRFNTSGCATDNRNCDPEHELLYNQLFVRIDHIGMRFTSIHPYDVACW
jgi:hypothetical protein